MEQEMSDERGPADGSLPATGGRRPYQRPLITSSALFERKTLVSTVVNAPRNAACAPTPHS
jgi:hypothetical protein